MKKFLTQEAVLVPSILIAIMVFIHLLNLQGCYGIIPRHIIGLKGILLAPLFHANWEHLFNNAVPIFVLSFMVFTFYKKLGYLLLSFGWILTGFLVWIFADLGLLPSDQHIGCHIGASGLVYVLASFVFFSGIFRFSIPLIAVSLTVWFLYASMFWGIFPEEFVRYTANQSNISWESHLAGGLVGLFFAFAWRKIGPQRKKWNWRIEQYQQQDMELWQRYLEKYPEEEKVEEPQKPPFKDLF